MQKIKYSAHTFCMNEVSSAKLKNWHLKLASTFLNLILKLTVEHDLMQRTFKLWKLHVSIYHFQARCQFRNMSWADSDNDRTTFDDSEIQRNILYTDNLVQFTLFSIINFTALNWNLILGQGPSNLIIYL